MFFLVSDQIFPEFLKSKKFREIAQGWNYCNWFAYFLESIGNFEEEKTEQSEILIKTRDKKIFIKNNARRKLMLSLQTAVSESYKHNQTFD